MYDSRVLTTGKLHCTITSRWESFLKFSKMPHLNSADKTDFDLGGISFYIIFLGDFTHWAVFHCVWRSYILLFSIESFLSLSNFPKFSPDLACDYGTYKYVTGRDNIINR